MTAPPAQKTELITLSTGRRVAVECYGDPHGMPVFFSHGWPSSRWQAAVAGEAATQLGIRLLSVDRPGLGDSDYHPGRRLADWPPLIAELADRLNCDKFRVLGISGGGPYALSCAAALPDRVLAAAVCCCAPPLAERNDVSSLLPAYRVLLWLHRRHPGIWKLPFRAIRRFATIRPPMWMWNRMMKSIPAADARVLADPVMKERVWAGYAGSWKGDRDGVFGDAQIYAEPWGFRLEDIRVPVRLWHGKADESFRWTLAEELAARIPGCTARFLDDEGHYSISLKHNGAILRDLRDCVPT